MTWVSLGLARPDYSAVGEPISGLGVGPGAPLMNGAFALLGLLTAAGALGKFFLLRELGAADRWLAGGALSLSGLGCVLCGVFTWQARTLHIMAATAGFGGPIIAFFVAGRAMLQSAVWRRVGTWLLGGAAFTLLLAAGFLILYCNDGTVGGVRVLGLFERVLLLHIQTWYVALALLVTQRVAPEARALETTGVAHATDEFRWYS